VFSEGGAVEVALADPLYAATQGGSGVAKPAELSAVTRDSAELAQKTHTQPKMPRIDE
jgi:hypothetical protein